MRSKPGRAARSMRCIRSSTSTLRIRDNGVVGTKVAYLAIGVDVEGRKHAPWAAGSKTASYRHRSRMHGSPNAVLRIVHIIPSVAVVHRHRTGPDAAVHNTWRLPREESIDSELID
jgi:hypothetical protein